MYGRVQTPLVLLPRKRLAYHLFVEIGRFLGLKMPLVDTGWVACRGKIPEGALEEIGVAKRFGTMDS